MAIDYQEILLEAVEIIANNNQSSNNNNDNSNSEKQENKPISILNPFGQMIQQEKFDIEEGTLSESGNNQISYTWIPQHQTKYDLLGLECNITTDGQSKGAGTYGIKIFIKASNDNFEQTFDSSMMLGNPWNFKNMLQKQIFDLEKVSNIQSIRITLYNESNADVIFDNVFLRLGQSVDNLGESSKPLIIYSDNEPQYTSSADGKFLSGLPQTLYVRWIYKKDNNYKAITHLNSEDDIPEGFTLRWYRWTPNSNFGDIYGGAYWSHINDNDNKFSYTIEESSIDPRAEEERYKIIVLQNNLDSDEISVLAESEYYSIKNNIIPVNEQITNRQMRLSDDGKYHFYAWDQEIIDEEFWRSTVQRTATISFETLLGEENFYNAIKSITWRIPEYQTNYVGVATSQIESKGRYSQLTYDKAKLGSIDKMKEAFTITYQISSHLYNDPMNKIQCIIDIGDGIEYLFEKEIEFRVSGSGGTDTSVIVRMVDEHGNVRAAIAPGETLYLEAKVYNAEGEEIEPEKIEWKLLWGESTIANGDLVEKYENGEPIYQSHKGSQCKIISNRAKLNESVSNQPWERGAAAVKALVTIGSYNLGSEENSNYKNLVIEEIFGIAMAEEGSSYIGPKEILYSSSGTNPQYSKSSVGLLGVELGENETLTVETFPEDINNEYPTIRNNIITPKNSLDMSLENRPFGLIFKKGSSIIWIQPIIIGINRYFSPIINEWDGSLQIDDDKNCILSSAYVAGGKNGSNQFTGVVMGELGRIKDDKTISTLETGLFGYYNGAQSFGFKTDGTAFLGRPTSGRISFDGNEGIIYSANFDGWEKDDEGNNIIGKLNKDNANKIVSTTGTYINLEDGLFIANNADYRGVITALAGSNIAGWETTENIFGKLGKEAYKNDNGTSYYYGIGLSSYKSGLGYTYYYPLAIGPMTGLEGGDWSQAYFKVDGTGKLFAQGAEIEGTLSATKGQVGGWLIDSLSEDNFIGGAAFENSLYAEFIESDDYYDNTGIRKRVTILRPGAVTDWAFVGLNIFGINNSYQEVFGIKYDGKILGQKLEINNSIDFSSGTGSFNGWIVSNTDLISSSSDFILSNVMYNNDPVYIYKPQEYNNGFFGFKPPVARLLVGKKEIINASEIGDLDVNEERIGIFDDNGEASVTYIIWDQIVEEITKITYEISEKNKEDFYAIPDGFGTRAITIRSNSDKSIVTIKFTLPIDSRTIYDQIRITINEYKYSSIQTNTKISYPLAIYSDGTAVISANKFYLYVDDATNNRSYYYLNANGAWVKKE